MIFIDKYPDIEKYGVFSVFSRTIYYIDLMRNETTTNQEAAMTLKEMQIKIKQYREEMKKHSEGSMMRNWYKEAIMKLKIEIKYA